jgi:hypothetical protein
MEFHLEPDAQVLNWPLSYVGYTLEATTNLRHRVAVLAAAVFEPILFPEITIRAGKMSLACLLETPVQFPQAPELFCLDFCK